MSVPTIALMGDTLKLREHQNVEVRWAYLMLVIQTGTFCQVGFDYLAHDIEVFVSKVGRMKYIGPIFLALCESEQGFSLAGRLYEQTKDNHHPQTRALMEHILKQAEEAHSKTAD